jgi:DNA mismatch endonuclease (patch repair protein)
MLPSDSFASTPAVRTRMQRQASRDTGPELAVRRLLHRRGLRYRVHVRPVAGLRRTGDIVFTRRKVAVFVDGCFWHGCPDCYGDRQHKTNTWYWPAKIQRNRARDDDTDLRLAAAGWRVVRIWEHESPETGVERIVAALGDSDAGSPS